MSAPPQNATSRDGDPARAVEAKSTATLTSTTIGDKPQLVDITQRIEARSFGRDEVVLYPVKELKPNGPTFYGIIRLGTGEYFKVGCWKHPRRHQLRFRLRTRDPNRG